MSDLSSSIQTLHLNNLSDSDSETTVDGKESPNSVIEMGEKPEKPGRLPLPLGNTTIETPTNFVLNTEVRTGSSVASHKDTVQITDSETRNGSFNVKHQCTGNRAGSSNMQQEKLSKCDSQLSTSPQRKLPIPNAAMNTNPNLKGILIKPKRILPAQPDHLKVKSAQIRLSAKSDDKPDQGLSLAGDVVSQGQTLGSDSDERPTSKSPIDVQKIKSYFGKHGAELTKSKNKDTDETNISSECEEKVNDSFQKGSQSECGQIQEGYLIREDTVYDLKATNNTSNIQEWNSSGKEENNNKMASETNASRSLERGIRSPSPKSNTTWDRSSSGYSSDERPDPRSPPPASSAGTSSKHSLDNEDENLTIEIDTGVANLVVQDQPLDDTVAGIQTLCNSNSESAILDRGNLTPESCSHTVTSGISVTPTPTRCNNCDIMSKNKTDLGLQTHSSAFESVTPGTRQLHKPVWTPLPAKIQYRKSVSEAAISLRQPGRQTIPDTCSGLEVLGKSYRQQTNVSVPTAQEEELEGRNEIPTPGSSDSIAEGAVGLNLTLDSSQGEGRSQEATKTRILKQQLMTLRSPRDMKTMNMNVGLSTPRDDKDIRKSLHDLNSPKRRSPTVKAMPIRARHTIHVSPPNAPTNESVTKTVEADTKTGIKFFGKKMWRAPSGCPDGPENRPFSPFGGTLPPAKINEKKKKGQEFNN